jgi:hypothetical protein
LYQIEGGTTLVPSYFQILRRHGIKLWLSNLVGNLAVGIVGFIVVFILLIGVFLLAAATLDFPGTNVSFEQFDQLFNHLFTSPAFLTMAPVLLLVLLVFIGLISAFQTAGSIGVAVEAVEMNRVDIGDYFTKGFRHLGRMFILNLLMFLPGIGVAIMALLSVPMFASNTPGGIAGGVLVVLMAVLLGIAMAVFLFHSPYLLVIEQLGPAQAFKKSVTLTSRHPGRVLGSVGLVILIAVVNLFLEGRLSYSEWILTFHNLKGGFSPQDVANPGFDLLRFLYDLFISPLVTALITLLVVHRYVKFFKPPGQGTILIEETPGGTPSFSLKDGNAGSEESPTQQDPSNPTSDDGND